MVMQRLLPCAVQSVRVLAAVGTPRQRMHDKLFTTRSYHNLFIDVDSAPLRTHDRGILLQQQFYHLYMAVSNAELIGKRMVRVWHA